MWRNIWNISSHLTDEFATDNIFEEVVSSCVYFDKLRRNQMSIYFISANKCNIVISARKCDIVISACKFDIVSFICNKCNDRHCSTRLKGTAGILYLTLPKFHITWMATWQNLTIQIVNENAGASKFTCCCRNLTVDLALSIFCLAFSYIT